MPKSPGSEFTCIRNDYYENDFPNFLQSCSYAYLAHSEWTQSICQASFLVPVLVVFRLSLRNSKEYHTLYEKHLEMSEMNKAVVRRSTWL